MVIPQRKDGGAVTRRSQGRRPIVLARLPQVGSSSPPVLSDVSSAPQSIHDDSHTDPSTMLLPPLRQDLPREGEGLNLYVDQGHSHSHRLATDRITVDGEEYYGSRISLAVPGEGKYTLVDEIVDFSRRLIAFP